ncbi:MAG: pilus assembly protein [Actinobacteria bacterium]|nr:pilus assembly protein [Actinomycetota bacterium]
MSRGQRGQATVEVALVLPVLVLALLLVVQVALVGLAHVLVTQAARNAARAVAVDPSPGAARAAATGTAGLQVDRIDVVVGTRGPPGSLVPVTVRYRVPTDVALVGRLVGDVTVSATVAVQVEVAARSPLRSPGWQEEAGGREPRGSQQRAGPGLVERLVPAPALR